MRRNSIIIIFLIITFLFVSLFSFCSTSCSGKTWYVDDDGGSDFTKIQDAIDISNNGDTV